jgi:eukaryotic-like serine/threonine-protein kinase
MSLNEHTASGSYEVLALLGAGGMSEVHRARDTRLDREVAIKVCSPAAGTPRRIDRLRVEERAISRLNHPNICTLYDIGQVEGRPFLVMELLDGRALADELERGPLPVDRALAVAQQIARPRCRP